MVAKVANKFEKVRWIALESRRDLHSLRYLWFATFGSELFGEQVWICISL